jgi:hypothetical protein
MIRRIALVALASVACAAGARAQVVAGINLDSAALRIRPDGGMLTPLILTYMATVQQGPETRSLGERSVQLSKATYAGLSAWEIVETRGAGVNAAVDSLLVDFLTLAPFHWGATQPMPGAGGTQLNAARVAAEFRADTMIGAMSSPGSRRTVVAAIPSAAYVTAAHFEVALRGIPLTAGFHDSTWVMISSVGKTAALPASIHVIGEENILTPAGTFDCWIVVLATELGRTQYWVSKPDHIVVQSTQVVPETGAVLQYQLSRISH